VRLATRIGWVLIVLLVWLNVLARTKVQVQCQGGVCSRPATGYAYPITPLAPVHPPGSPVVGGRLLP
jgi:hypothetical protein